MTNCIICSRYTNNRKQYLCKGKVGVVCNYCKEHGRIKGNLCVPVNKQSAFIKIRHIGINAKGASAMKRCIECGHVSTDEDCRVYENVPVIREDGSHAGYTEREHTCDCCPECGAIVLDD